MLADTMAVAIRACNAWWYTRTSLPHSHAIDVLKGTHPAHDHATKKKAKVRVCALQTAAYMYATYRAFLEAVPLLHY